MARLSIAIPALLFPLCTLAAPLNYTIDPVHSFPSFTINHLGMSNIAGRFDKMSGKIVLDQAAKTGSLDVKIETASVNTGDARHEPGSPAAKAYGPRSRDEHLRTADFFNSAEFPDAVFKSTQLHFNGENVDSIEGNLTLVGVTKPIKLQVVSFKCAPNPFTKKPMCGANAEATIKRSEFGIKTFLPAIADEVKVSIGVEAYQE